MYRLPTEVEAISRHISHDGGTEALVDSTQAVTSQNTPASVENIAVLDAASRLSTDYLDLHLGLELNTNTTHSHAVAFAVDSTFKAYRRSLQNVWHVFAKYSLIFKFFYGRILLKICNNVISKHPTHIQY